MTSIKLNVTGAVATATVCGKLTSGMVGIPVTITYDSAWEGLTKHLICRSGDDAWAILHVGNESTVAPEVMIAGRSLYLGIEGRNADGKMVIPTVYAYCGMIYRGANVSDDISTDPTLPIWAQLQNDIDALKKICGVSAFGKEDGGKLLYLSEDGSVQPLALGNGLKIVNGVLMLTVVPETGEAVEVTAMVIDGVEVLVDNSGKIVAQIIDNVETVTDSTGTVTAEIIDGVEIIYAKGD